jgi:formylglycine-generating enzyme required for sulfatase activity
MEQVHVLRIVVASPGDVQAERDALPAVLEDLNRGIAAAYGLRLELGRWETDAYPGFHPQGPQGLIDPILHIEDCDVLLGIFWKRFGTPTTEAGSGTEHEFLRAYAAWQQHGRPQIMVYFNQEAATPKTKAETDQWGQVLEFQEHFPREGLWWPYRGKEQFERLVRNHLTQFLRQRGAVAPTAPPTRPGHDVPVSVQQHGSGGIAIGSRAVAAGASGVAIGGDVHGNVYLGTAAAPEPTDGLRDAYLTWLMEQVRAVPLTGVDPKSIREETRRDLDLAAVYTALMTQRTDMAEERTPRPDREAQRLSALAVLNTEPHLALLGDPGSGKSTFINFVALCMAGELCHHPDANLRVLTAPVPEDNDTSRRRGEEEPQPQPWDHGALLPMRVVLREFVARGLPHTSQPARVHSDSLWRFIIAELPERLRPFESSLHQQLLRTGGLLLLDGLDEVPEADQRRVQVKTAVEQFAGAFPKVRMLVTSRTYAYQRQDWKLRDFAEAVLAPFGEAQMHRFVERWYAYVGQARRLSANDTQGRATLLKQAIARTPRLYELATRPLLLTLMASLHAWRGGTLPEQREALYADAVDLLLDQWESQKVRRLPDGTYDIIQPSLEEWLRVDQQAMRQALNRLAFEAHRDQPALVGTADIAEEKLVSALLALTQHSDPDLRPARLIEHLRDRAGLLEPRGIGAYAFPHRTFQEYLAACYLTDVGFPDDLAALLRAEPNRWREVTLLAGAKAVRGTAAAAWTLAEALCFEPPPTQPLPEDAGYWAALLAAQVLVENKSLGQVAEHNRSKVERIRTWLVRTLRHNALPAVDRAQAGDALADVGDPRFRADAWYLPDELLLGFMEIPAGPFLMGSDDERDSWLLKASPQHKVTLPTYYMARYPVTVAQFRTFVEASGYAWEDRNRPQGAAHHPIVYVSWHDALAYCKWLTARLQEWSDTPEPLATLLRTEDWRVILPSEAEWEKAARGIDGRAYPWGNEPDPNRANYNETGINTTSAVGCFPHGASPYGVEELSGNVWEWTRSLGGDYPYPVRRPGWVKREDLQASEDAFRVQRGGAFWYDHQDARCASRDGDVARGVEHYVGFRVALAGPP